MQMAKRYVQMKVTVIRLMVISLLAKQTFSSVFLNPNGEVICQQMPLMRTMSMSASTQDCDQKYYLDDSSNKHCIDGLCSETTDYKFLESLNSSQCVKSCPTANPLYIQYSYEQICFAEIDKCSEMAQYYQDLQQSFIYYLSSTSNQCVSYCSQSSGLYSQSENNESICYNQTSCKKNDQYREENNRQSLQCVDDCEYNYFIDSSALNDRFCLDENGCTDTTKDYIQSSTYSFKDENSYQCLSSCLSSYVYIIEDSMKTCLKSKSNCSQVKFSNGTEAKYLNLAYDNQCVDQCSKQYYYQSEQLGLVCVADGCYEAEYFTQSETYECAQKCNDDQVFVKQTSLWQCYDDKCVNIETYKYRQSDISQECIQNCTNSQKLYYFDLYAQDNICSKYNVCMNETVYNLRNNRQENPGKCLSECYNGSKYLYYNYSTAIGGYLYDNYCLNETCQQNSSSYYQMFNDTMQCQRSCSSSYRYIINETDGDYICTNKYNCQSVSDYYDEQYYRSYSSSYKCLLQCEYQHYYDDKSEYICISNNNCYYGTSGYYAQRFDTNECTKQSDIPQNAVYFDSSNVRYFADVCSQFENNTNTSLRNYTYQSSKTSRTCTTNCSNKYLELSNGEKACFSGSYCKNESEYKFVKSINETNICVNDCNGFLAVYYQSDYYCSSDVQSCNGSESQDTSEQYNYYFDETKKVCISECQNQIYYKDESSDKICIANQTLCSESIYKYQVNRDENECTNNCGNNTVMYKFETETETFCSQYSTCEQLQQSEQQYENLTIFTNGVCSDGCLNNQRYYIDENNEKQCIEESTCYQHIPQLVYSGSNNLCYQQCPDQRVSYYNSSQKDLICHSSNTSCGFYQSNYYNFSLINSTVKRCMYYNENSSYRYVNSTAGQYAYQGQCSDISNDQEFLGGDYQYRNSESGYYCIQNCSGDYPYYKLLLNDNTYENTCINSSCYSKSYYRNGTDNNTQYCVKNCDENNPRYFQYNSEYYCLNTKVCSQSNESEYGSFIYQKSTTSNECIQNCPYRYYIDEQNGFEFICTSQTCQARGMVRVAYDQKLCIDSCEYRQVNYSSEIYCVETEDCNKVGGIVDTLKNYSYAYENDDKYCYTSCRENNVHYINSQGGKICITTDNCSSSEQYPYRQYPINDKTCRENCTDYVFYRYNNEYVCTLTSVCYNQAFNYDYRLINTSECVNSLGSNYIYTIYNGEQYLIKNQLKCEKFNEYEGFENFYYVWSSGSKECLDNCKNYTELFYRLDTNTNRVCIQGNNCRQGGEYYRFKMDVNERQCVSTCNGSIITPQELNTTDGKYGERYCTLLVQCSERLKLEVSEEEVIIFDFYNTTDTRICVPGCDYASDLYIIQQDQRKYCISEANCSARSGTYYREEPYSHVCIETCDYKYVQFENDYVCLQGIEQCSQMKDNDQFDDAVQSYIYLSANNTDMCNNTCTRYYIDDDGENICTNQSYCKNITGYQYVNQYQGNQCISECPEQKMAFNVSNDYWCQTIFTECTDEFILSQTQYKYYSIPGDVCSSTCQYSKIEYNSLQYCNQKGWNCDNFTQIDVFSNVSMIFMNTSSDHVCVLSCDYASNYYYYTESSGYVCFNVSSCEQNSTYQYQASDLSTNRLCLAECPEDQVFIYQDPEKVCYPSSICSNITEVNKFGNRSFTYRQSNTSRQCIEQCNSTYRLYYIDENNDNICINNSYCKDHATYKFVSVNNSFQCVEQCEQEYKYYVRNDYYCTNYTQCSQLVQNGLNYPFQNPNISQKCDNSCNLYYQNDEGSYVCMNVTTCYNDSVYKYRSATQTKQCVKQCDNNGKYYYASNENYCLLTDKCTNSGYQYQSVNRDNRCDSNCDGTGDWYLIVESYYYCIQDEGTSCSDFMKYQDAGYGSPSVVYRRYYNSTRACVLECNTTYQLFNDTQEYGLTCISTSSCEASKLYRKSIYNDDKECIQECSNIMLYLYNETDVYCTTYKKQSKTCQDIEEATLQGTRYLYYNDTTLNGCTDACRSTYKKFYSINGTENKVCISSQYCKNYSIDGHQWFRKSYRSDNNECVEYCEEGKLGFADQKNSQEKSCTIFEKCSQFEIVQSYLGYNYKYKDEDELMCLYNCTRASYIDDEGEYICATESKCSDLEDRQFREDFSDNYSLCVSECPNDYMWYIYNSENYCWNYTYCRDISNSYHSGYREYQKAGTKRCVTSSECNYSYTYYFTSELYNNVRQYLMNETGIGCEPSAKYIDFYGGKNYSIRYNTSSNNYQCVYQCNTGLSYYYQDVNLTCYNYSTCTNQSLYRQYANEYNSYCLESCEEELVIIHNSTDNYCTEYTKCSQIEETDQYGNKYTNRINDQQLCVTNCSLYSPKNLYQTKDGDMTCVTESRCSDQSDYIYRKSLDQDELECVESCGEGVFAIQNQTDIFCLQQSDNVSSCGEITIDNGFNDDFVYQVGNDSNICASYCSKLYYEDDSQVICLTENYCLDAGKMKQDLQYSTIICIDEEQCEYKYIQDTTEKYCTQYDVCDENVINNGIIYQYQLYDSDQCIENCTREYGMSYVYQDLQYCVQGQTNCSLIGEEYNEEMDVQFYENNKSSLCIEQCQYNWYYDNITSKTCTENNTCKGVYSNGTQLQYEIPSENQCVKDCPYFRYTYSENVTACTAEDDCDDAFNQAGSQLKYLNQDSLQCVIDCTGVYWYYYKDEQKGCLQYENCTGAKNNESQYLQYLMNDTKQCIYECQYLYYEDEYYSYYSYHRYICSEEDNCKFKSETYKYVNQNKQCNDSSYCNYYEFQYNEQQLGCTNTRSCTQVENSQGIKLQYIRQQSDECIEECQYYWYTYSSANNRTCTNYNYCDEYNGSKNLDYIQLSDKQCVYSCEYKRFNYSSSYQACTLTDSCNGVYDSYGTEMKYIDRSDVNYCQSTCDYNFYMYTDVDYRCTSSQTCNGVRNKDQTIYFDKQETTEMQCVTDCPDEYWYMKNSSNSLKVCTLDKNCNDAVSSNSDILRYLNVEDGQCVQKCTYNYYTYNDEIIGCTSSNQCDTAIDENGTYHKYVDVNDSKHCIPECQYYWYEHLNDSKICTQELSCEGVTDGNNYQLNIINIANKQCVGECTYNWFIYYNDTQACTSRDTCQDAINQNTTEYKYLQIHDKQCVEQCQNKQFKYNDQTTGCTVDNSCDYAINSNEQKLKYMDATDENKCVGYCDYNWYYYQGQQQRCSFNSSCELAVNNQSQKLEYLILQEEQCVRQCTYNFFVNSQNIKICTEQDNCQDAIFEGEQTLDYLQSSNKQCTQECTNRKYQYNYDTVGCTSDLTCESAITDNKTKLQYYDQTGDQCVDECQYFWYSGENGKQCTVEQKCQQQTYLQLQTQECSEQCNYKIFQYNQDTQACTNDNTCDSAVNNKNQQLDYLDEEGQHCIQQCPYKWYQYNQQMMKCASNCQQAQQENGTQLQYLLPSQDQCIESCQYRYYQYDDVQVACTSNNSCTSATDENNEQLLYRSYDDNNKCLYQCDKYWYQYQKEERICLNSEQCDDLQDSNGNSLEYRDQSNKQCIQQCNHYWFQYNEQTKQCTTSQSCTDVTSETLQSLDKLNPSTKQCIGQCEHQYWYVQNSVKMCSSQDSCDGIVLSDSLAQGVNYDTKQCLLRNQCVGQYYYVLMDQTCYLFNSINQCSDLESVEFVKTYKYQSTTKYECIEICEDNQPHYINKNNQIVCLTSCSNQGLDGYEIQLKQCQQLTQCQQTYHIEISLQGSQCQYIQQVQSCQDYQNYEQTQSYTIQHQNSLLCSDCSQIGYQIEQVNGQQMCVKMTSQIDLNQDSSNSDTGMIVGFTIAILIIVIVVIILVIYIFRDKLCTKKDKEAQPMYPKVPDQTSLKKQQRQIESHQKADGIEMTSKKETISL